MTKKTIESFLYSVKVCRKEIAREIGRREREANTAKLRVVGRAGDRHVHSKIKQ